nr:hypothetical protein [Brucella anthropi]
MQGSKQSGKHASAGRTGALAIHHGAWPHASVRTQENQGHGGMGTADACGSFRVSLAKPAFEHYRDNQPGRGDHQLSTLSPSGKARGLGHDAGGKRIHFPGQLPKWREKAHGKGQEQRWLWP